MNKQIIISIVFLFLSISCCACNETEKKIVDKRKLIKLIKQYLIEKNDSSAQTYIELADNIKIDSLERFRDTLRFVHKSRNEESIFNREIVHNFLRIYELVEYCQENSIEYKPDQVLHDYLLRYNGISISNDSEEFAYLYAKPNLKISEAEKYKIQNEMMNELSMKHIDMLEYLLLLDKSFKKSSTSGMERVLNDLYEKYSDELISKEENLKHTLKKASIFYRLKYINNDKLNKISLLKYIDKNSIGNLAKYVLDSSDKGVQLSALTALQLYIRNDNFQEHENVTVSRIFHKIISRIKNDSIEKARFYLHFLDSLKSIELVPSLMEIVDDERLYYKDDEFYKLEISNSINRENKITVSDEVVRILESIYEFSFRKPEFKMSYFEKNSTIGNFFKHYLEENTAKKWKELWQKDSSNYRNWGKDFYKEQVKIISKSDSVDDKMLNILSESKYRDLADTLVWKNSLKKIKVDEALFLNTNKVYCLDSIEILSHFFEKAYSFHAPYKYVKNENDISFRKFFNRLQKFSDLEQGKIFTTMIGYIFSNSKFKDALMSERDRYGLSNEYIIDKLEIYLKHREEELKTKENVDYLEMQLYPENRAIEFVKKLSKSRKAKLHQLFFEKEKGDIKFNANWIFYSRLFYKLQYQDLEFIITNLDSISHNFKSNPEFNHLFAYFGIPVLMNDDRGVEKLIKNYKNLSEYELFKYYALEYYPDLYNNGKLNYKLIQKALQQDTYYHFKSDDIHFWELRPLIKILEMEHKKNINDSYLFSINGVWNFRIVKKWEEYLKENGYFDLE